MKDGIRNLDAETAYFRACLLQHEFKTISALDDELQNNPFVWLKLEDLGRIRDDLKHITEA